MDDREAFERLKSEAKAEEAVVRTVHTEAADVTLMTVARAKARMAAYERVSERYTAFIEDQAEKLRLLVFADSPFKELGVARLIAAWMTESEAFLKEAEGLLAGEPKMLRNAYLARSFERLPEAVRERLLGDLASRKQELLIWFVGRVEAEISGIVDGEIVGD